MKRNQDGSLYHELTNKFTVLGHLFKDPKTESILYLPYEKVMIFTDKTTPVCALKYIEGDGMFENYVLSDSGEKIFKSREFLPFEKIPVVRNFSFNCYGQSFCDGLFWLNFGPGEEEQIINDDKLKSTDNTGEIKTGSKILLYDKTNLVHAILVNSNQNLLSKDGTNILKTHSDLNAFNKECNYSYTKMRILN